jgi:hypothetical protein
VRVARSCDAAAAAAAAAAAPAAAPTAAAAASAGGGPGAEDPEPPAPAAAAPAGQLDVMYVADVANSMGLTNFMAGTAVLLGVALPVVYVRKRRGAARGFL